MTEIATISLHPFCQVQGELVSTFTAPPQRESQPNPAPATFATVDVYGKCFTGVLVPRITQEEF